MQKLAAKLQLFTKTGRAQQSDLRAIDNRISSLMQDHAEKTLHLLLILKDSVPKTEAKEFANICEEWRKWVSEVNSKETAGYAKVSRTRNAHDGLLERILDMDSKLFSMLSAFNSLLSEMVAKASYEVPDLVVVQSSTSEIASIFYYRQRALASLA